jgi:hypothetical protein
MESDVKQAFDAVFKRVNTALGNQKTASIKMKSVANSQLAEILDLKTLLTSQTELITQVEKLERQLKKG